MPLATITSSSTSSRRIEYFGMSAAIFYHPEAYSIGGPKLMGRQAAGSSFLRAYLKHREAGGLWVNVAQPEHANQLRELARGSYGIGEVNVVGPGNLGDLARPGALYYPDPRL